LRRVRPLTVRMELRWAWRWDHAVRVPGPWPGPKSHRLIQVAGGGTRSTPMKKLCVCGKTVKVTDRKWA
jgi:hypothetical protein